MSFQISHESIVPNSTSPASARSRSPSTWSSSQRIFGPEKYVASGSPQRSRKRSRPASPPSSCDEVVGAHVLPGERVVDGRAGRAVPQHGRLALVRDPEPDEVADAELGGGERVADDVLDVVPDLLRVVLDVARAREDRAVLDLADGDDAAAPRRR